MTEDNENPSSDDATDPIATVSDTVGKVAKSGVWDKLLGPTAEILGEELARRVKARLNGKQLRNLEEISALSEQPKLLEAPSTTVTPTQVGALVDWIDGAKDINTVTEPALAKAWSKALNEIKRQEYTLVSSLPRFDDQIVSDIQESSLISNRTAAVLSEAKLGRVVEPKRTRRIDLKAAIMFPSTLVMGIVFKATEYLTVPSNSSPGVLFYVFVILASFLVIYLLFSLRVFESRDGKRKVGYSTLIMGEYGGQSYKWLKKDPQLVRIEKALTGKSNITNYYLVERSGS
ncbi:hypothetical protein [Ruegeria sp. Ofav3-42]|uniref:hypothetical protein n=1 Tax=Ruegeria sp. Ofav3-42 TaxID=2917759 RepID=UPI001EF50F39|nr:hypothetical protein [Ruegeria sp. Ofav3-42]MCG7518850.1 hypothetical protein [Ruegeria sp. Ofav3-42]